MKVKQLSQFVFIFLAVIWTLSPSLATAYQVRQYIAPIECTEDEINDGVETQVILSPEECYKLLNPTPAVLASDTPIATSTGSSPRAPNTGFFQMTTDYLRENRGDVLLFTLLTLLLFVFVISIYRMAKRRHL